MVEMAIALPFLVILSLGLAEFAVYLHDQGVVTTAVQEGAHAAAALQPGSSGSARATTGAARTRSVLAAGLSNRVYRPDTPVEVSCLPRGCIDTEEPDTVEVHVQLALPIFAPGLLPSLPLARTATVNVERFRPGL